MADGLNDVAPHTFYLVTEPSFHARYLIGRCLQRFEGASGFRGIGIRSDGLRAVDCASATEDAMRRVFGSPPSSMTAKSPIVYLGSNLNAPRARGWLEDACADEQPFMLVFLDQLLASWWISTTGSRLVNAHSAVLPFARGMHAIEQVAATQDSCAFSRAAGATVHYVDTGVDSGPIIRAQRFARPFDYTSIWHLKAHALMLAFDLLIDLADSLCRNPETLPVGLDVDPSVLGPNFRCASFTPSAHRQAELGYEAMKRAASAADDLAVC
jgi:phosphoribosylglycinamide formyltransferase-1